MSAPATYSISWYHPHGDRSITIDLPFGSPEEVVKYAVSNYPPGFEKGSIGIKQLKQ